VENLIVDLNKTAFRIVSSLTGEKKKEPKSASGRAGGLVGGRARAASLTPQRRKDIAVKAISTRWKKRDATETEEP